MLLSWPVLERQHQFRVLKWEFGWQLWHWARSSEIMKQTSGKNPNPPWLDAGINGLIKASLFMLVDRFTRNKPNLLYTFPSLACRHLPALAGVSALTSMWFGYILPFIMFLIVSIRVFLVISCVPLQFDFAHKLHKFIQILYIICIYLKEY